MNANKLQSSPPAERKSKRGSWSVLAGMVADFVSLGSGDGNNCVDKSLDAPSTSSSFSLPAIHVVPTKTGDHKQACSISSLCSVSSLASLETDPGTMNLRVQAKQQASANRAFPTFAIPTIGRSSIGDGLAKKDPLIDFLEKRDKAAREYKKQQLSKKKQHVGDCDSDDKSLSSASSLFDLLTWAVDDELHEEEMPSDGDKGGNKAFNSSFLSLFGSSEEKITKLSSTRHKKDTGRESRDRKFAAAAARYKSVKGARLYNRGKQAADNQEWNKAVAYYHIALVKQRKYYGEDHIVTSDTLNELGVALMHLGESFGAITALNEALHIRQKLLHPGAKEVAETTSNLWKVLNGSKNTSNC